MSIPRTKSATASHVELECIGSSPGVFKSYLWKNVGVVVWSGAATLESTRQYRQVCELCRKRFPGGISSIQLVIATKLPDSDARRALASIIKDYNDLTIAMATVILPSGFIAGALRGLITNLALPWLGTPSATKVHGSVEDVLDWLPATHEARTGVTLDRAQLLSCMTQALAG